MATKKAKTASKSKSSAATKTQKAKTTTSSIKKKTETLKAETFTATPQQSGLVKSFFSKKYTETEDASTIFQRPAFIGALVAEIIGVFLLTTLFLMLQANPHFIWLSVIGVTILVYSISGANLNPLVTLGLAVTRRISAIRAVFYILAQAIGAMLAFVMLRSFISVHPEVSAEMAQFGQHAPELFTMLPLPADGEWHVLAIELIGAIIIGLFFARALQYRKSVFTFAATVGLGVSAAVIFASVATMFIGGGSFALNPAIALSMEAFNNDAIALNWGLLVYLIAPLAGGIIGFILNDILATSTNTLEK